MLNVLVFILGTAVGIVIIRYVRWFYENVSHMPFFERYLGDGGGYLGWRIFALAIIIVSWIVAFNYL